MLGFVPVDVDMNDAISVPAVGLTLHHMLKGATRDVHERLHRHAGFAALQNDTMNLMGYQALVRRLYGFYSTFEVLIGTPPIRTNWLEQDLLALGLNWSDIATLPRWRNCLRTDTAPQLLGALYVVEGSALGGRALSRHLDAVVGIGAVDGRRFFLGHGVATGKAWRDFLARLAELPSDAETQTRCIASAVATFAAFETWLAAWDNSPLKRARMMRHQ